MKIKNLNIKIPQHVAIIPDGNRRWARERGLPTFVGHRYAAEKTLPTLIKTILEFKIPYFTFWALSTENFIKRSKEEIDNLFNLIRFFLKTKEKEFNKNKIRLKIIGNLNKFPLDIKKEFLYLTNEKKENYKLVFTLGLNYGGREEIIRAIKKVPPRELSNLNEDNFSQFLYTNNIPDPELIIRTGGEKRLSGFMLWQSQYSELYFTDTYFPDFNKKKLIEALVDFNNRQRRFGR